MGWMITLFFNFRKFLMIKCGSSSVGRLAKVEVAGSSPRLPALKIIVMFSHLFFVTCHSPGGGIGRRTGLKIPVPSNGSRFNSLPGTNGTCAQLNH